MVYLESVNSGERSNAVLDVLIDSIIELNLTGEIIYLNRSAEKLFQINKLNCLGKNFSEISSDFQEIEILKIENNCDSKYLEQFFPSLHKWLEIHCYRSFNGHVLQFKDITKFRLLRNELEDSKATLKAILDNSLASIYIKDLTGKYTVINNTATSVSKGFCAEDFLGKNDYEIFPSEIAEEIIKNDRKVISSLQSIQKEEIIVSSNDSLHVNLSVKFPIIDSEGKPKAVCGISTDISHLKKLERSLRERTNALEKINNIGRMLTSEFDFQKLIQIIIDAVTDLTKAQYGVFCYTPPHDDKNSCIFSQSFSFDGQGLESILQAREHFFSLAEPVSFQNSDELRDFLIERKISFIDASLESFMFIPIKSRLGQIVGGLFFGHKNKSAFTELERDIALGLAAQASIALDNARLFHSLNKERLKAEENEKNYRFLAESIPQIVWTAEPSGQTDYCNQRWLHYTGLTVAETSKSGLVSVLHPDDLERCSKKWQEATQNKETYEDECRFKRASDGAYRWHLSRAVPLKDKNGEIVKWFGTSTDIHDQKKFQEKLMRSESKLRKLVDANIIGVFIANCENRIVSANEAFLKMLGYTAEELCEGEISWRDLTPPEYKEVDLKQAEILLAEGTCAPYEKEYISKSGHRIPVLIGATLHDSEDGLQCIAFVLDISERKELDKRKDEFISMASHELKTPVTSVKIFAQILQKIFSEKKDDESLLYLAKMDDQISKLTKLINDLLDVSKMHTGKLALEKENFRLDQLLAEIVENIQISTKQHQIILQAESNISVFADRCRVEQVIINLITNALKYSPQAEKAIVTLHTESDEAIISVQDFGIGIPSKHLDKIFGRFYRVLDKNEHTFPGLGIGLFISSEIIKHHNGKIWVESIPGEGSTFSFSLPF